MILFERLRRIVRGRRSSIDSSVATAPRKEATAPALEDLLARAEEFYQNAIRCRESGKTDDAIALLGKAIDLQHDFAEAHFLLGQIHRGRRQLDDASDCLLLAAHFRADFQEAYRELGMVALDGGRLEEAQEYLQRAVSLNDEDPNAQNALGAALHGMRKVEDAVSHFRRAIKLAPDFAEAHSNLGYVLFRDCELFEEGARHMETALGLAPHNRGVRGNWTMVLQHRGRFQESMELSEQLLSQDPDLHEVRFNRGLILLTRGKFHEGWKEYEARKHLRDFQPRHLPWPDWNGAALADRTIYVYGEQGLGDQIMFASCLPDVISLARRCVIECSPKLETLFRRSFPKADVIVCKTPGAGIGESPLLEGIDYQAAMGSLPGAFRNKGTDFPQHSGYLRADTSRIDCWKRRLDQLGAGVKVGLSWRGGLSSTRRSLRSIDLEECLPILHCDGAHFISLQYTDCRDELSAVQARHGVSLHHWQEAIDDYDETAALVCALDLVITVQTALAHLAGALGKTTWVMLSAVPEWRYTAHGSTMPWYPSVRLFRQAAPGEWAGVIEAVTGSLANFAGATEAATHGGKPNL